jgi:hypothetical protein
MDKLNIPGIENGYVVDVHLWRGAQPADSAWPLLAKAGCKSVLDLNSTGAAVDRQRLLAHAVGMELLVAGVGWPATTETDSAAACPRSVWRSDPASPPAG